MSEGNESVGFQNSDSQKQTNFLGVCYEYLETISVALISILIVFSFFFRIANVEGWSMENTLHNGDKIFVWRWNYTPTNGDIVVISRAQMLDEPIVKRIIATQGQSLHIDFSKCTVEVDGKVIVENYIKEPFWHSEGGNIPEVVPKGYTFVMGDNRNGSTDSRSQIIGLIDNNNIVGKVCFVLFPIKNFGVIS